MSSNKIANGKNCSIGILFSENNKVVIPDMQREYCWAKTINPITGMSLVYNFVQDIVNLHDKSAIRMGLIYAYQAPQTFFQLCDGQQRITTLYLLLGVLHKRILQEGDLNSNTIEIKNKIRRVLISEFEENNDDKEPRLQYAIRESTLWFTRDLVNEFFLKPDNTEIMHSSWYFDEYRLDPSIENMVDAIKIIQGILSECTLSDIKDIANFVVEKISFLYYDMGNRQYGEEQFVVINTTGVGLSNTENLKPKLILTISNPEERGKYSSKWENEWEQFFWDNLRNSNEIDYVVDKDFNEFLRWVFIIEKSDSGTLSSESNKYNLSQKALNGEAFNIMKIADGDGLQIAKTLDYYLKAYKLITEKCLFPGWKDMQRDKNGRQQPISQIDALRFLPLLYFTKAYLSEYSGIIDEDRYIRNFMRLKQFMWGRSKSRNISRASIETVPRAIQITRRVCSECNYDIAKYPLKDTDESRFFTAGERIKYGIYNKKEYECGEDNRRVFENSIWNIEALDCCQGNITFVFDTLSSVDREPDNINIEDLEAIKAILEKTLNKPDNAFKRALLTYGDYSIWIGSTPSLNAWKYSLGDDADFFRNLLLYGHDEKKRQIVLDFLSDAFKYIQNKISPHDDTHTTDIISKTLDSFMKERVAQYSNPAPDSPWKKTIDKLIIEPKWLDKSSLGHFAWDESQQQFYVLHIDRSNQGFDIIN